jgi:hypothetical protein
MTHGKMFSHVSLILFALHSTQAFSGPYDDAFVPEDIYAPSYFVTANGDPNYCAPMIWNMVSAGDTAQFGGGQYAKVGVTAGFYYARMTEGAPKDWRFQINGGHENRSLPLPPDVVSLDDLPTSATLDMPSWCSTSKMARAIAGLEWARYYDLPISFQMHTVVSHGGSPGDDDLNLLFEGWQFEPRGNPIKGKYQCMWDVADICDPDDDPTDAEPAGASWGTFSFATPTLADPDLSEIMAAEDSDLASKMGARLLYQDYVKRNLQEGMQQLLSLASHPRYRSRSTGKGLIVGFAISPEIHMPAHNNGTLIPRHPDYGGGTVNRYFFEDYHPVMVRQFALYEKERYGDSAPNVDSNGDGATFWGDFGTDYAASGGFGHDHSAIPAAWEDIDPPRKYPVDGNAIRTAYWQEWCNFRIQVVDDFIQNIVDWAIEAGVPATRMYTHQTPCNSSYQQGRMRHPTINSDWLDDWIHVEASGGFSGLNKYHATDIEDGKWLFWNLARRDDGWGSPEFNPMVKQPGVQWYSLAMVRTAIQTTWNTRGHVMWAHSWGNPDYPVFDSYTTKWVRDISGRYQESDTLGLKDPDTGVPWTVVDFNKIGGPPPSRLEAQTESDSYLESPAITLDADAHPYLAANLITTLKNGLDKYQLRMQFQKQGDATWYEVQDGWTRDDTFGTKWVPIHMASHPQWTGTIVKLRFYPVRELTSHFNIAELVACSDNSMTIAFRELLTARKDTPRPALSAPSDIQTPEMNLAAAIETLYDADPLAAHLVIFGTDPVRAGVFSDFGYDNNFYRDTVECGGVSADAIVAPAPSYLGMRKTGKFRRLRIPQRYRTELSFAIGIQDGYASADGVGFRVVLRDQQRNLHTLFDKEWRWNRWSETQHISLDQFRGQTVDIAFETRGISETTGDQSVWGEPKITFVETPATDWEGYE